MKLGRVPPHYKTYHVCAKCGEFGPLFDLDFARLCPACVEKLGGIVAAGEQCRDEWKAAAEARREANGLNRKRTKVETPITPPSPARDARLWKKAESLHKAMRCTPEEAYDRLVEAEAARERHGQDSRTTSMHMG